MNVEIQQKVRRTAPKEVRQQQLIEATLDAIAERGISGTTTAQVAKRAGLSVGTVMLHFDSKENLLKSTLNFLAEELRDRWSAVQAQPDLSDAERLWGIIEANFHEDILTDTKLRVWFAFFGEAQYRAYYREMVEEFDTERGLALETLLEALAKTSPQQEIDPFGLTQSIESMADGLWLGIMLYPDWLTIEDAKARLWSLLSHNLPEHFKAGATPETASIK